MQRLDGNERERAQLHWLTLLLSLPAPPSPRVAFKQRERAWPAVAAMSPGTRSALPFLCAWPL